MFKVIFKPKNEIVDTADTLKDAKVILDEVIWYSIAEKHGMSPHRIQMKDIDATEYDLESSLYEIISF